MPTQRKEDIVTSLTEKLGRSKAVVFLETKGMTVADQAVFRKKLRVSGMEFQVVKNTLFRIATRNVQTDNIDKVLNGPTAVVLGYGEEIDVAKAVADYLKTAKNVTVKAGLLGKRHLTTADVENLSKLPGRQELRAQAVGTLAGPAQQIYGVLTGPMRDLVNTIHNYTEKQGAEA